jgi:hypothetical protein
MGRGCMMSTMDGGSWRLLRARQDVLVGRKRGDNQHQAGMGWRTERAHEPGTSGGMGGG